LFEKDLGWVVLKVELFACLYCGTLYFRLRKFKNELTRDTNSITKLIEKFNSMVARQIFPIEDIFSSFWS